MRSYQIFAAMDPEQAERLVAGLAEKSPGMHLQALAAASLAMKARPAYLRKLPAAKRAQAIRRALARIASDVVAGEVLAVYFLECRKELLTEWLDAIGLEHEDGILKEDAPKEPAKKKLLAAIESYLAKDADPERRLLLSAFAAQGAIDWPTLEARLAAPAA